MRQIIFLSFGLLLVCFVNAQTSSNYTFIFNDEKVGLDTFHWQKDNANIRILDAEDQLVLSIEIQGILEDSIVVIVKDEGRYPEGVEASWNVEGPQNDTREFPNLKFKKYELHEPKDDSEEYLFELKLKFGKKPKLHDFLIFPAFRHLFSKSQTVQFHEKSNSP